MNSMNSMNSTSNSSNSSNSKNKEPINKVTRGVLLSIIENYREYRFFTTFYARIKSYKTGLSKVEKC